MIQMLKGTLQATFAQIFISLDVRRRLKELSSLKKKKSF